MILLLRMFLAALAVLTISGCATTAPVITAPGTSPVLRPPVIADPVIVVPIVPPIDPVRLRRFEAFYVTARTAVELGLATGAIHGAAADRVRLAMPAIDALVERARIAAMRGHASAYADAVLAGEQAVGALRAAAALR